MKPSELADYLAFAIQHKFPVLIKGRPGIGKSDIGEQAVAKAGAELILSHPVVSDPTDYKGLPYPMADGTAEFLPIGDLRRLIHADHPTVFFLDDLGQASVSVQAACMQLLLARRINGHLISDQVVFMAATNRREDKAGVAGLLEPVKSRFASIVELEVDLHDWVAWALDHDMPLELIAFVRFRPDLLDQFEASRDIVNSPCPRTIASVGRQQTAGLEARFEFEAFKGAAGEAFAIEYRGFLQVYRDLPTIDEIIMNPSGAPVSQDPCTLYATCSALAGKMNDQNIGSIFTYLDRLPKEIGVACVKDAVTRNGNICKNRAFIQWSIDNAHLYL